MNLVRYGRLLQNTPWFFSHQLFSFSLLETYKFKSFLLGAFFQPLFDGAIEKAQVQIAH